MASEREQIEAALAALQAQRAAMGDTVVDTAQAALRARLARLDRPAPAEQLLRQVSVLFLDIVGSTALVQGLDAEDAHAVLDGVLRRCTAIVNSYGGKVLQYAGDNLLAVFGAERAREDDAERAVRCALALREYGSESAGQLTRQHGQGALDLRIGVHTGRVLLGGGVDAERSIRGSTVHIAARMEQSAPAGCVRISHATYRLVQGAFDVQAQAPLTVKGLDEPLVTYLVQRAAAQAFRDPRRGIEGVRTRMIGRDAELARLQEALAQVARETRLVRVTIVAEAGLGKSRLLHEFMRWLEVRPEPGPVFQARAHPRTQAQPYGLLRDMLAGWLGIADDASMDSAKSGLEQGIATWLEADAGAAMAQAHAHVLGQLIGLDFTDSPHVRGIRDAPRQIRDRGFHAAAQIFRRACTRSHTPALLLLDDLHFADEGSLDFLDYLERAARDVALLVIGLTRPGLFERRPETALGTQRSALRIDLSPLDRSAAGALADELLGKLDPIPDALRDMVSSSAEGNPFYMEELVKMLIDEGAIVANDSRWSVDLGKLATTRVPHTLAGVLQARLDGLQAHERLALQQASVIGHVFWDQALAAIDAAAPHALPALSKRELAVPHTETALEGLREYAFKHQILHHVVYDTVLKPMRRAWHALAAAWLAALRSARANDFLGATAEHYEKAGNAEKACETFARAAEHAGSCYAHDAALDAVARALALLDAGAFRSAEGPPNREALALRWRLLEVRERMHNLRGRRDAQWATLDAMQAVAEALDDDALRAQVGLERSIVSMRLGNVAGQKSAATQAMACAERAGDPTLHLFAQRQLADALANGGDTAAAEALATQGLESARAQKLRKVEAAFLNTLSVFASLRDAQFERLEWLRQLPPMDRETGNLSNLALNLGNLGATLASLGQFAQAQEALQESLQIARAIGDKVAEPYALAMLSDTALSQGDAESALHYAQCALDIEDVEADAQTHAMVLCLIGASRLALGEHGVAAAAFVRSREIAVAIDNGLHYDAAAGLARVELARGNPAGARQIVEPMLEHLALRGSFEGAGGQLLIEWTCHQVLAQTGDARAASVLEHAHASLRTKAASISDAGLRQNFLDNVGEHREIVAAWNTLHGGRLT